MKSLMTMAFCLAVFFVCATSWSLEPDDPALVGLWLCDEGEGDVMIDSSGNENNATGTFTWGDGKFDGGILVSEGSIIVPTTESIDSIVDAVTASGWFRIDEESDTGIRRQNAFLLEDASDIEPIPNAFTFRVWTTSGLSPGIYGKTELEQGKWYHVAGTYDGEMMRLYINGVEEKEVTDNVGEVVDGKWSGTIETPADELQLKYGNEIYIGAMDEIIIFNRALSAKEIKQLASGWQAVMSVTSRGKLSSTWGKIKSLHQ